MKLFPCFQPMAVATELAHSFPSHRDFGSFTSPPARLPSAHEPLPALGSEQWTVWSGAVVDEARQATDVISSRHWRVVHPADVPMLALLAHVDAGDWSSRGMEVPRLLHWISRLDGRAYTLVEFFSLTRQPASSLHWSVSEQRRAQA